MSFETSADTQLSKQVQLVKWIKGTGVQKQFYVKLMGGGCVCD